MDPAKQSTDAPSEAYSVFTRFEKWCIVGLVAYAAFFSTVSSLIYFPIISLLADTFSVSVDKINLAVTCYMAVATIAPVLVGDTADTQGRRPVYIFILTLYVASNTAMASLESYVPHLSLRVLQALAISGTISTAYGVVTDVASPAERGSYVNVVSFAVTIAPTVGPVLGGSLSYAAGWAWVFWFLSIAAGACLLMMIFFLPETSRSVVYNGSILPPRHLRLPIPRLFQHWEGARPVGSRPRRMPNPLRSLKILTRRDNAVVTLACGCIYTVYICVSASLSVLFIDLYGLNQWQVGLTYIPLGIGGVVSTAFCGRLMDSAYRAARTKSGLTTDLVRGDNLDTFPIEKARLAVIWIPMLVTWVAVVGLGWVLYFNQHIGISLALIFIIGLAMQMDFSIYNTLLVDKNHRSPAAAQASSNVVRCTMAAISMAFLQRLIDAVGIGWAYTMMGGLCLVALGLFCLDYVKGTAWRQEKLAATEIPTSVN